MSAAAAVKRTLLMFDKRHVKLLFATRMLAYSTSLLITVANAIPRASSGDLFVIWGELDSGDLESIVLEWADESLPVQDAPDARILESPGGKPRQV